MLPSYPIGPLAPGSARGRCERCRSFAPVRPPPAEPGANGKITWTGDCVCLDVDRADTPGGHGGQTGRKRRGESV